MVFKVVEDKKSYIEFWNEEEKIGYYAIEKLEDDEFVWVVRKFNNEPFSAKEMGRFETKREAVRFILEIIDHIDLDFVEW